MAYLTSKHIFENQHQYFKIAPFTKFKDESNIGKYEIKDLTIIDLIEQLKNSKGQLVVEINKNKNLEVQIAQQKAKYEVDMLETRIKFDIQIHKLKKTIKKLFKKQYCQIKKQMGFSNQNVLYKQEQISPHHKSQYEYFNNRNYNVLQSYNQNENQYQIDPGNDNNQISYIYTDQQTQEYQNQIHNSLKDKSNDDLNQILLNMNQEFNITQDIQLNAGQEQIDCNKFTQNQDYQDKNIYQDNISELETNCSLDIKNIQVEEDYDEEKDQTQQNQTFNIFLQDSKQCDEGNKYINNTSQSSLQSHNNNLKESTFNLDNQINDNILMLDQYNYQSQQQDLLKIFGESIWLYKSQDQQTDKNSKQQYQIEHI